MAELLDDDFELPQKEPPKPSLNEQQNALQQWISMTIGLSIIISFLVFYFLFDDFDQNRTTLRNSILAFSSLLRFLFIILLAISSTFCSLERRQWLAIFQKVSLPQFGDPKISKALAEFLVGLLAFAIVVIVMGGVVVLVTTIFGVGQAFSLQKTTILISIGVTAGGYGYRAWQLGSAYLTEDNR